MLFSHSNMKRGVHAQQTDKQTRGRAQEQSRRVLWVAGALVHSCCSGQDQALYSAYCRLTMPAPNHSCISLSGLWMVG